LPEDARVAAYIEAELELIGFLRANGYADRAAWHLDELFLLVFGGGELTESERRLMDGNR
jgi:hypothetical protein